MVTSKELEEQQYREYLTRITLLNRGWVPHEGQRRLLNAIYRDGKKRIVCLVGRKGGKTEALCYTAVRHASTEREQIVAFVGPTLKQMKRIIWNNFRLKKMIPKEFQREIRESETRILFPDYGSYIEVMGANDPDNDRGTEADLYILDEFGFHDQAFFDSTYPNLLARDGIMILITTPNPNPEHWTNRFFQEVETDPDWLILRWTSFDNPHISQDWLRKEKAKYEARGDAALWALEYEARVVPGGKRAVFPRYVPDEMLLPHDVVMEQIAADREKLHYFTVFDPGTVTCFAVGFFAYSKQTGQVWQLDEIYETRREYTSSSFIWARAMEKEKELYPEGVSLKRVYDEAAQWFANEISNRFRVGLSPSQKRRMHKETGISLIKDMQAQKKFILSDRCQNTHREFIGCQTDEHGKILEGNDHQIDNWRYFLQASGYRLDGRDVNSQLRSSVDGNIISPLSVEFPLHADIDPSLWLQ